ncbi:MAG: hypothetical protein QOD88_2637 [Mycobacterium sp.]|jgi:hypothetical protein|nr:hypothetical protein [Mycobacterium sp.]
MFQAIPTSATNLLFTSPGAAPRCNMAHTLCASRLIATGSVIFHPLYLRLPMNCRSYHATISGEIPTSGGGGACTVDGDACTVVAGGAGAGALVDAGAGGGAAFIVGVGLGAGAGVGRESLPGHARCPNQTAAPTAMPTSATMAAMTHVLRQVWGSPSIGSVSSDHASAVADSDVGEIDVPSVAAGPASVGAQFGRPVVVGSGPASEEPDGGEAGGVGSLIFAGLPLRAALKRQKRRQRCGCAAVRCGEVEAGAACRHPIWRALRPAQRHRPVILVGLSGSRRSPPFGRPVAGRAAPTPSADVANPVARWLDPAKPDF